MSGGLAAGRLGRLHDVLAGYVERGAVPGLVALVSRGGDTHVDAIGAVAYDAPAPMRRDTIFRIASMTKPMTATAAMICVEECLLRLDEPVDALLPELANRQVLRRIDGPLDDTVTAERAITVRDLLTFRMGFGALLVPPDTYPIQTAVRELSIGGDGPPTPAAGPGSDEWLRRLGSLPLMAQPGERWLYHVSGDVLGILIARATGQAYGEFLRERVLAPLGTDDTGFCVPPEKLDRLPTSYGYDDPHTGKPQVFDEPTGQWSTQPAMEAGAGGLVSTVDDCLAFSRMLLGKGRYDGRRILSRPSVDLMTADHLTAEQREDGSVILDGGGWGFGMGVRTRRDGFANPGQFGWAGGLGTTAYADPEEDLVGILMTQKLLGAPEAGCLFEDFWTSTYQAIDD